MPWYWSDEVAKTLLGLGKIDPVTASRLIASPVAFRLVREDLEDAAQSGSDDDETSLLAA